LDNFCDTSDCALILTALSCVPMKRSLGLFVYTEEKSCPQCGSNHVHRTKRGRLLEFWVLLFLPYRPYRCGKCRQRFYGPKKMTRSEEYDEFDEA
jgi:ribosomal protein L37AE/L43A